MKKNDIIKLMITDVTMEGIGVGRFEDMVVFVSGAMIGEEIESKIIKITKRYAVGKIEKIITPSKNRVKPDCPHYKQCGGCSFRHMSYESELNIKQKYVCDALSRIGGFTNIKVQPIIKADKTNYYRNKTQIPVRKDSNNEIIAGFFRRHSHDVINCDSCLLHPKYFNEIIEKVKLWIKIYNISVYDEHNHQGLIRHIYIRVAEKTDEIMVCLVAKSKNIPFKDELLKMLLNLPHNISSVILNVNSEETKVILGEKSITLWGKDTIRDNLCGLEFDISPLSFYQVNKAQTEKLYEIVRKFIGPSNDAVAVDLYCGIGTITLIVSSLVRKVIGVEVVKDAIKNAIRNADNNKITNTEFICSDATTIIDTLKQREKLFDIILLDPPRKGCSEKLINDILKINPKKVIYVSCNPSTLARDLKIFCKEKYSITSVVPVDMFPRTSHVETVVILSHQ